MKPWDMHKVKYHQLQLWDQVEVIYRYMWGERGMRGRIKGRGGGRVLVIFAREENESYTNGIKWLEGKWCQSFPVNNVRFTGYTYCADCGNLVYFEDLFPTPPSEMRGKVCLNCEIKRRDKP